LSGPVPAGYDGAKEKAMIELTPEQRQVLAGDRRVCDPQTHEICVLVREDLYQQMHKILDSMTRSAGWDDPSLDDYEKYRTGPKVGT
jgi:hypothetical protein